MTTYCPECGSTRIKAEYAPRYSTPGERDIYLAECEDCHCEFRITLEETREVTKHGDRHEGEVR